MSWWQVLRSRYTVSADPLRTQRRIELLALLLGTLICLQLVLGFVGLATTAGPGAIPPAPDSLRVPAIAGPAMLSAQQRNEIISRPLFWVGRRPLEAVEMVQDVDAGQQGSKDLDPVKLVGLFGAGKTAGVIVLVKGKKQRILLGEKLEGWTLESVESGQAVFSRGARREELALQRAAASASPDGWAPEPMQQVEPPAVQAQNRQPVTEPAGKQPVSTGVKGKLEAKEGGGTSLSLGPGDR